MWDHVLAQGGLGILAGALLWLLVRTQLRQDRERVAFTTSLEKANERALDVVAQNTVAQTNNAAATREHAEAIRELRAAITPPPARPRRVGQQ